MIKRIEITQKYEIRTRYELNTVGEGGATRYRPVPLWFFLLDIINLRRCSDDHNTTF